jgi:4-carboxymuconolactone decarboxylase
MTTRDELFQRGEAIRRQLQPCPPASATPSAASAIAGMARLTGEVVFGALNVGLSKQEVVEVLMHTAPYSGFPKALNALTLAQEVLG